MINKLLEELNQKTEILNNVLSDKKYFDDLEKRIEKVNKAYIIANVERDKYKEVIDKIKAYLKNNRLYDVNENCVNEILLEMLVKIK